VPGWARVLVAGLTVTLVLELWVRSVETYLPPRNSAGVGEVALKRDRLRALATTPGTPALVFIGDSMMDAAVDPDAFLAASNRFPSAYNAALMGARLQTQARWANDIVLPTARPKMVVHGMSPTLVSSFGMDPQGLSVYDSILDTNITSVNDDVWSSTDEAASDLSSTIKHRNSLRYPSTLLNATWARASGGRPFGEFGRPDGFWEKALAPTGQIKEFATGKSSGTVPEGLLPHLRLLVESPIDYSQVNQALAIYRTKESPLVVVIQPAALDAMRTSGINVEKWRAISTGLADHVRATGVPVIDFTDAGYPNDVFFDPFHLNAAGSTRYSADLARRVADLCQTDPTLRCP